MQRGLDYKRENKREKLFAVCDHTWSAKHMTAAYKTYQYMYRNSYSLFRTSNRVNFKYANIVRYIPSATFTVPPILTKKHDYK